MVSSSSEMNIFWGRNDVHNGSERNWAREKTNFCEGCERVTSFCFVLILDCVHNLSKAVYSLWYMKRLYLVRLEWIMGPWGYSEPFIDLQGFILKKFTRGLYRHCDQESVGGGVRWWMLGWALHHQGSHYLCVIGTWYPLLLPAMVMTHFLTPSLLLLLLILLFDTRLHCLKM